MMKCGSMNIWKDTKPNEKPIHDWTYQEAKQHLIEVAKHYTPSHVAYIEIDTEGNPIVICTCSWHGNGIGWWKHIHDVIHNEL